MEEILELGVGARSEAEAFHRRPFINDYKVGSKKCCTLSMDS